MVEKALRFSKRMVSEPPTTLEMGQLDATVLDLFLEYAQICLDAQLRKKAVVKQHKV